MLFWNPLPWDPLVTGVTRKETLALTEMETSKWQAATSGRVAYGDPFPNTPDWKICRPIDPLKPPQPIGKYGNYMVSGLFFAEAAWSSGELHAHPHVEEIYGPSHPGAGT